MTAPAVVARDVVIVACALSAGVHAALAPTHLQDGEVAAVGFVAAAALLAGLAVALTRQAGRAALGTAALAFAGLLGSYALVVTTGVPLLHPGQEAVDGLALATKAVEAAGLFAALGLLLHGRSPTALHLRKGHMT